MFTDNTIHTEDEAYILGFLYADGYIPKPQGKKNISYTVSITLSFKDKEILEKLYVVFSKNGTTNISIKDGFATYKTKKYKTSKLYIKDRFLVSDLTKHGIIHRKTYQNSSFVFDNIPIELKHHFVRGYFDGDGSIFGERKHTIKFISLNYKLIKSIDDWLVCEAKLNIKNTTNRVKLQDGKYPKISYSGNVNCKKIESVMYKDASIFLNRKREKFLNMPDLFKRRSKYNGVCWNNQKNRWMARVYVGSTCPVKYLGLFVDEESAYHKVQEFKETLKKPLT